MAVQKKDPPASPGLDASQLTATFSQLCHCRHGQPIMDEFCLEKMETMLSDLDHLIEGTDPSVQSIPNVTVNVLLKKVRKDLKQVDTRLFMNSKFMEGLIASS